MGDEWAETYHHTHQRDLQACDKTLAKRFHHYRLWMKNDEGMVTPKEYEGIPYLLTHSQKTPVILVVRE
jgi:hypothetical protein